jgi:hypothetical protein
MSVADDFLQKQQKQQKTAKTAGSRRGCFSNAAACRAAIST